MSNKVFDISDYINVTCMTIEPASSKSNNTEDEPGS